MLAAWCKLRGLSLHFSAREHAGLALFGAIMYCVAYIFVYHAEEHLASGLVAVGYSAGPLLAMFGLRIAFGQPMTARMALGSAFGMLGIVFVFWPEFDRLSESRDVGRGALFTILAVVATTLGGLLAHRNHERKLHGLPTMAWSMGYGGVAALALALAMGRTLNFEWTPGYVFSMLYLVVLGSIAAFAGWLTLLGRIGAARASYVGVMVPVVALILSTFFEGLPWHPLMIIGIAISVAGNVLMLRGAPGSV